MALIGSGDTAASAHHVHSDGKETMPTSPDNPKGAYTAAHCKNRACRFRRLVRSAPYGFVETTSASRLPVTANDEGRPALR